MLAVATKYYRPELHTPLLAHAHSTVNQATNKGQCGTDIVQSLLILVYWKTPADRSGWIKIGIAARMGYQLGWHLTAHRQLPHDERAARKVLVGRPMNLLQETRRDGVEERTWGDNPEACVADSTRMRKEHGSVS